MRFEGTDTGTVLFPFVLPQVGVVAAVVLPVFAHVLEQIPAARVDQNQRDIAISPLGVTKLVKAAITMIGPMSY